MATFASLTVIEELEDDQITTINEIFKQRTENNRLPYITKDNALYDFANSELSEDSLII
jgi:serine phosphatase RsbU (regulator of sigma subunit)